MVGAGPTGLTLAAQLRAFGATVRLVDRQVDRVHESRALAVQPRTLEVLRGLGVAEDLAGRGNDAVWVQLHVGGRVVGIRLFGLGLAGGGVPVERGVEVVGFHADPAAVTCTLRHRDGRTEQVHGPPPAAQPRSWRGAAARRVASMRCQDRPGGSPIITTSAAPSQGSSRSRSWSGVP